MLGGAAALSAFLHVPDDELARWIRGEVVPPMEVFNEVVEMLLQTDGGFPA